MSDGGRPRSSGPVAMPWALASDCGEPCAVRNMHSKFESNTPPLQSQVDHLRVGDEPHAVLEPINILGVEGLLGVTMEHALAILQVGGGWNNSCLMAGRRWGTWVASK